MTRASRECGCKAKKPTTQPRGAVCLPVARKPTTPPAPVKSLSRHKAVTERGYKGISAEQKEKALGRYQRQIKKQNENQPSFEVRFSLSLVDQLGLEPRTDRLCSTSPHRSHGGTSCFASLRDALAEQSARVSLVQAQTRLRLIM